jgi:hypothetical protein
MEAVCFSETSVGFQRAARGCTLEDRILKNKFSVLFGNDVHPTVYKIRDFRINAEWEHTREPNPSM